MLDFISVTVYGCKCRHHGITQNGWQEKALTDGACAIFMHMNADVSYMKQGPTTTIKAGSKVKDFSDADSRC